jgi:hypothetical protein
MTEAVVKSERFSDAGELIYEFNEEFLVECSKCSAMARVFPVETGSEKLGARLSAPRKLVCSVCTHRGERRGGQVCIGAGRDWYFGLPLWLKIECCGGKTLWAYSARHLNFIENYVGARLRARRPGVNKSMASRLPQWIKSAKNRNEILQAIKRLKEKSV